MQNDIPWLWFNVITIRLLINIKNVLSMIVSRILTSGSVDGILIIIVNDIDRWLFIEYSDDCAKLQII